jgi:nitroimidazol reductase NimA-like FMN-containing flavoprotein (pyridoxamine 5'-phosphate oxidase superfamily)
VVNLADPDLKNKLKVLFKTQKLAVLGSDKGNQPYPSLIAFAHTDNLKNFVFSTLRNSNKYANIMINPKISMLIDNRSNQPSDFSDAIAVSVFGHAEEVKDDKERLLDLYLEKHPYLKDFVGLPNCVLLRINVTKYSIVSQFQNVEEIII